MSSPYPPSAPKKLYRSRSKRMIAGVCGGLADYLNMDPTLVRILTVVISLFTGIPVVLYIVALFVVPEEPAGFPPQGYPPVNGAPGLRQSVRRARLRARPSATPPTGSRRCSRTLRSGVRPARRGSSPRRPTCRPGRRRRRNPPHRPNPPPPRPRSPRRSRRSPPRRRSRNHRRSRSRTRSCRRTRPTPKSRSRNPITRLRPARINPRAEARSTGADEFQEVAVDPQVLGHLRME